MIVLCLLILLFSRKPLIPLMSIKARMATRKVIKLSRLHMKTKSSDVQDNDWITDWSHNHKIRAENVFEGKTSVTESRLRNLSWIVAFSQHMNVSLSIKSSLFFVLRRGSNSVSGRLVTSRIVTGLSNSSSLVRFTSSCGRHSTEQWWEYSMQILCQQRIR